ncbi:MAG: hypothetical protein A2Y98_02735 [Candidatus Portnoybacteria bacterium RBG_19FT_COMBO_36_7]|uniref:Glycosyltransferase n=1 Tax=Candidatus Portnoybacteria bacterium RBG_19FT_COMBO_36_7 TaxID=1801992 RepID=A0A1G2FAS0_9BACT|nr:MAG: hypothetical protein A2Y98_02735 [Candidatus Portnoybacteria bacterium RBG_19FT_COMBO_36_7]
MQKYMYLIGVRIDNVTIEEAFEKIRNFLSDGRQHQIVTVNPEFIVRAQKDDEFKRILNEANLVIPDGMGIIWASRILREPLKERVAGVDLIKKFKVQSSRPPRKRERCGQAKFKVFLLGGRNGVAEKLAAQWSDVVGFSEDTDNALVSINQCQPDILLVALGAPKQEKWISENLKKIPSVKLAIGVGGAFDMMAGKVKRAPKLIQEMGMEWLWRLILQPWRAGRIFNAVIIFTFLILREKIKASR